MIIRQETPEDFDQIYDLVKVAFQTAKVSNGKEQDFVNQLRAGGNYLPELALVVEENGEIIGHIMLTKAHITGASGKFPVLLLAPVSIVLSQRGKGIGSRLIRESFGLARKMGYGIVLLVGDPSYYVRFGFNKASSFGIKPTHDIPDENVMVCELAPGVLKGVSGIADCF